MTERPREKRILKTHQTRCKPGAKAVANKVSNPDRDLETEYNKEKLKEKLD